MKLKVAWIGKSKDAAIQSLTAEYLKRLQRYGEVEALELRDEAALLRHTQKGNRRACNLILLDSRGKQLSSEELAKFLDEQMTRNPLPMLFAVGGADGFTAETRKSASFVLSLGRMTLPHDLARVVLLEQLYRACTILQGHPYHLAH